MFSSFKASCTGPTFYGSVWFISYHLICNVFLCLLWGSAVLFCLFEFCFSSGILTILRSIVLGRNLSWVCKQAGLSACPHKGLRRDCAGTMFSEVRVKAGDIAWENSECSHRLIHHPPESLEFYLFFKHWNNSSLYQWQLKKASFWLHHVWFQSNCFHFRITCYSQTWHTATFPKRAKDPCWEESHGNSNQPLGAFILNPAPIVE